VHDESRNSVQSETDAVRDAARSLAFDRYLSALLAPRGVRDDLIALAAYLGELARIPLTVADPQIAEIRLEWWRGAVEGFASGADTGNPIADAMGRAARRFELPVDLLLLPIEGRSRELYEDGVPDRSAFEAYFDETEGAAFRLALRILGVDLADVSNPLCHGAASALGRTHLALAFPRLLAKGRLPFPAEEAVITGDPRQLGQDPGRTAARRIAQALSEEAKQSLADFRASSRGLPPAAIPAFLPLALIGPYLRAIESPRHDALTGLAEISPLTRVFRLWRAHWRGRI
jgi:phytoene synthase